jgi:hypothetical protein
MTANHLAQSTLRMEFQLARSNLGLKVLRLHFSGVCDLVEVSLMCRLEDQQVVGD